MAIRADGMGAMHAQLRSLNEPNTYRTVAVASVLDIRQYAPVEP